jgi:RNA recognition motif-containing protein
MIIEISNLSMNVVETDLRRLFTPFGEISSIEITRDRLNNRSKGKAFIDMPVAKEARQAVTSLNGSMVRGKSIILTLTGLSDEDEKKFGVL